MNSMYILATCAFIFSVAAFPANYPESSDLSLHLDEGDLETLEPQAPATVNLLSLLLARNAGFTTDLKDTDMSASPEISRDSRSPHHWYTRHYYKPQQFQYHGESHHYKPQHHGESYHNSYQHYKPAHHYNPRGHYY